MRTTLLLFIVTFLWGCSNIRKNVEIPKNDREQAVIAFDELKEILRKENGQLWNYSLEGPIMLVNRDTRTIIANEKDDSGKLFQKEAFYVGKLSESINIANTAFDWNGKRWTMVALPLPETKEERLNLLIHESFHRIQPIIDFDSLNEVQSNHLESKEGRIYLKLELEALKNALKSDEPKIHLQNALLFRKYRHQIFTEAKHSENSLEINEGIAEYTGSILSQRKESDLQNHYISQIDAFYNFPTFVRSFAYFTIPIYGYFMQQTDRKWNLLITDETNLTDFILNFFDITQSKLDNEKIMLIGDNYNINSIIESETEREIEREKLINNYKIIFLGDSVVSIGLENMSIEFDPSNIMPLDSFGTVYPNLRITDNWGILEVDSCGALMSHEWNKVTISYPEFISDNLISGKGWKLMLNKSWQLDKVDSKYNLIKE